jgi:hypothetical protein
MQDVREVIERLEAAPAEHGDWDAVMRDARVTRRRSLLRPVTAAAAVATALFALALFQPWESEKPSFLERALAAVDDGSVLHVKLRGEWGGTNVDLESSERTPIYGENETWFDPRRNLVHSITTLGGVVLADQLYEPGRPPEHLTALARDYREALRAGTARVTEEGVVDGERVSWITIESQRLPDVADGKDHEWTQQVAVSHETAEPVATRETRDGHEGPFTRQRLLSLEMLSDGEGDFTDPGPDSLSSAAFVFQPFGESLTVDQAADVLGRRPLWAGQQVGEFELGGIGLTESWAYGKPKGWKAGQTVRVTDRANLIDHARGVVLFYGEFADNPATYREDVSPRWERPHVAITQSNRRLRNPAGGRYVPPEGSVFLRAGGRFGFLQEDGVFVTIEAETEELILEAARALEPIPR